MADDTIEKPAEDTSSALAPAPALEPPKSASATPAPVASRTQQIGEQAIAADLEGAGQASRTAEEYAKSVERERQARLHQQEVTRPAREETLKTIEGEEQFLREHPRESPATLPPRPELKYDLREIIGPPGSNKPGNQVMQAISVFAALSGGTTQERVTLALEAFHGMMTGWAQGKKERFEEAYSAWRDEIANIHDTETRKRQYVNDVLNDTKTSFELKAKKIELLGMEDGDTMLAEQAVQKNLLAADKFLNERIKHLDDAVKHAKDIDKSMSQQQLEMLTNNPGIRYAAERALLGDASEEKAYRSGTPERKAVETLVAQLAEERGITPEAVSRSKINYEARQRAANALATRGPYAYGRALTGFEETKQAVEAYENLAQRNVETWLKLGNKLDEPTGLTIIDRFIRGTEADLGNPDVIQFRLLLNAVRNEVERVMTTTRMNGVLTVHAMKDGERWADEGLNVEQRFGLAQSINDEFKNRKLALQDQAEVLRRAKEQMDRDIGVSTTFPEPKRSLEDDLRDFGPAGAKPDIDKDIRELVPGATVH